MDGRTGDVTVHVHATGKHDATGSVEIPLGLRRWKRLDEQRALHTVEPVRWVVDSTTGDGQLQGMVPLRK